jgi:hypothetical protein
MTFSCFLTSTSFTFFGSEPDAEVDAEADAEIDGGELCDRRTLRSTPARSDKWSGVEAGGDRDEEEAEDMPASTISAASTADWYLLSALSEAMTNFGLSLAYAAYIFLFNRVSLKSARKRN